MAFAMLTGVGVLQQQEVLLVTVCILEAIVYLGLQKGNQLFPSSVLKLNTRLWPVADPETSRRGGGGGGGGGGRIR